jgi:hypothetical protein
MAVNEKARVRITADGSVNVHVNADTLYNVEAIQRLLPKVLGPLGCRACCSGWPINWVLEENEFQA